MQVWALAVAPGDDTLVMTGGAEGVINLWDDKTLEIDEDTFKKSQVSVQTARRLAELHALFCTWPTVNACTS
jgi:hypothetical protein